MVRPQNRFYKGRVRETTIERPFFRHTVTRLAFKALVESVIASMNLRKNTVFSEEAFSILISTADYIKDGTYPYLQQYNEGFYMTCGKRNPSLVSFPIAIKFQRNKKRRSRRKM